jgi:hypothetical protein
MPGNGLAMSILLTRAGARNPKSSRNSYLLFVLVTIAVIVIALPAIDHDYEHQYDQNIETWTRKSAETR